MSKGQITNRACWREAKRYLAGGVNSPVRSFKAVGGNPIFADRGRGAYLWDVEGKRYLDYVGSWGALILGHRHPAVLKAVEEALSRGTTFGTPTPQETALARAISEAIPSMEQIRFVNSGTEAVMSVLRLARAATGRRKIVKFDGAYHGHSDALLTRAGSGMATLGLPASPGVTPALTQDTLIVPFNDLPAVKRVFQRHGREIACILTEPILANVGVIAPEEKFLNGLRALTKAHGALLIFDEVITGFRVAYGGTQALYGVRSDMTILGKTIGGGFPVGAYGGKRKLMQLVAPAGPVYQAGTLAGHPVAMAAGLATLKALKAPGVYQRLELYASTLGKELTALGKKYGIPLAVPRAGSLFSLFFADRIPRNAAQARGASTTRYARYFRGMLRQGVYLPPSSFEGWFLSTVHGQKELSLTVKAHAQVLKEM